MSTQIASFWVIAALLALAVAAGLALPLARARRAGAARAGAALTIYRDQLAEIERDAARGLLDAEEAERARLEVSRRLLAEDRAARAPAPAAGVAPGRGAAFVLAALVVALSAGLYLWLGAPRAGDQPLAERLAAARAAMDSRPSQAAAEAEMPPADTPAPDPEHAALMERLRAALEERPDDEQGHRLLARNEAALGNYAAAYRAQRRLLLILGPRAEAADFTAEAEYLIRAAGGYVSPQAEAALSEALRRDPQAQGARYWSGLMFAQNGRPDLAFRLWRPLAEAPHGGPEAEAARRGLPVVARAAGIPYDPPAPAPATRGPNAADLEAAGDLSPEAQLEMGRAMAEGLAARLASEGGSAAEWAQLVRALGVLGEVERARAILEEARGAFADDADALALIEAAAHDAGIGG